MTNRGVTGYKGDRGEDIVDAWLSGKGYAVLARKYRSPYGEIDVIAQDGETVVFVEVKYRKTLRFGTPAESVDARKQGRIRRTALCYIAEKQLDESCFRFDVVEIYGNDSMRIEHIENAFD